MTVRRAVSLGVLVVALLGIATGVSHIGHSTTSKCQGTWRVVVGHTTDPAGTATENSRAIHLVPATCTSAAKNPKGGYDAYALFATEADAQAYLQQLVAAGYAKQWGFQPTVEQAPTNPTP